VTEAATAVSRSVVARVSDDATQLKGGAKGGDCQRRIAERSDGGRRGQSEWMSESRIA
jgi:hypothetical protein